jgi:hypothetical protein
MMRTLHLVEQADVEQRAVWRAFPSWAHFSWLYLLSALSALRGVLLYKFGAGALLLACAAALRHWARYELTRDRLTIQNYYTGREIHSIRLHEVENVIVQQGMVACFFGIGMVLVRARGSDRLLSLRGVSDLEELKIRIEALSWKHRMLVAR